MDPNACMQRLLNAVRDKDRFESRNALRDLVEWLQKGGFPPVFNSEMAGVDKWGKQKWILVFHDPYEIHIQRVFPIDDNNGWELVRYNEFGTKIKAWQLPKE